MPDLEITGLTKTFDDHVALDAISLEANAGELLTLLGPSGCGKSTTLWSIAGLHRPDAGRISIGDRVVFDGADKTFVPPEKRECGVVFQSYAIWPNMTVAENVGYPLGLRRIKGAAKEQRVREVLELVELGDLAKRYPHQLSGGQQQRVALARALASPPRLLLLDEPFSNLDAKLRDRARVWLKALQREIAVTTIFVTHDQDEALSLSDRVAVMSAGQIRQLGTPEEVYNAPADVFVADFVGTINLLDVTSATDRGDHVEVGVAGVPVAAAGRHRGARRRPADRRHHRVPAGVGARPRVVCRRPPRRRGEHVRRTGPRRRLPRRPLPLPDRRRRHAGHGADDAHRVARRPVDGRDPTHAHSRLPPPGALRWLTPRSSFPPACSAPASPPSSWTVASPSVRTPSPATGGRPIRVRPISAGRCRRCRPRRSPPTCG